MKKISLLYSIVVLAALSVLSYSSCKKIIHSNAPTPGNIRLHSYTATTQTNQALPFPEADTINDNYTFTYDGNNRVSQILFTSNDLRYPNNQRSETITFRYSNDTVYKTTMTVPFNTFYHVTFETDTFLLNTQGLITNTYEPGHRTNYEYYGQLLDRKSEVFYHDKAIGTSTIIGTTTISNERIYNSVDGDFLNYTFNGVLTVNYPNGTYPYGMNIGTYPMREYLVYPTFTGPTAYYYTIDPNAYLYYTQTGGATSTTQTINGYSEWPLVAFAVDTTNDTAWVAYPGNNIYGHEDYTFYTTMANRIGDYLQLNSYTKYGVNLYRNKHLVKSISNPGYTTTAVYNIDAQSMVSQMTVKVVDSVANTKTTVYNLQYEKY